MTSGITSSQRIQSHNGWPEKIDFSAELLFQKKLTEFGGLAPFRTANLANSSSTEFHRYLSNIIDGLDALPQRPDYLFDHCFRVIDAGSKILTGKSRTTYAISEAYLPIFSLDSSCWTHIVNQMCARMPKSSADYMARRLLDASIGKGTDPNAIVARARKCLGGKRFAEITQKYAYASSSAGKEVNELGTFLRLLLRTIAPLAKKSATAAAYPSLDLTLPGNLLDAPNKLRVIMSLFLFTMRNERQHGSVASPFRTSMGTLARYASYYYAMICAYTICLGVISIREPTSITAATILSNLNVNLTEFGKFFGANAN